MLSSLNYDFSSLTYSKVWDMEDFFLRRFPLRASWPRKLAARAGRPSCLRWDWRLSVLKPFLPSR